MTTCEYNDCVKQFSDDLYRFALRYTGDGDTSRDAVQDAFVTLWEQHEELKFKGVKGYLIRVLYRILVSIHRHEMVCRNARDNLMPKQENYEQHHTFELHDAMQKALKQLPEIQRQLLLLKDLEGYDYGEMAAITGINEQQVGVYLFRARKRMRELLTAENLKPVP